MSSCVIIHIDITADTRYIAQNPLDTFPRMARNFPVDG